MKLVMTLVCRDEADIIRENLETHLYFGVDHVIATDHASVDGTRDILAEYEQLGIATVIDQDSRDLMQSKWMTQMAELARTTHRADWVLNNDADEFWIPETGTLKDSLDNKNASVMKTRRLNMVYAYDADSCASWVQRTVYRAARRIPKPALNDFYTETLEFPYFYHDLPPKALTRTNDLACIRAGNHDASYYVPVEQEVSNIHIFHFPVRSLAQFTRKIANGAKAILWNEDLRPRQCWHLRRWYRMAQNNGIVSAISDALPDQERLNQDLKDGVIVEDNTMRNILCDRVLNQGMAK